MLRIVFRTRNNILGLFRQSITPNLISNQLQMYSKSMMFMQYASFAKTKPKNKLLKTYQKIKQKKRSQEEKDNKSTKNQYQDTQNQLSSPNPQPTVQPTTLPQPHPQAPPNQNKQLSNPTAPYTQKYRINCQGCNVVLQSKDDTKFGYINEKVLKQAIDQNVVKINKGYGEKIRNRDAKILDFMHQVERESGIKIFDEGKSELQNMDNVQVLMRLQQKIDKYQKQQQLLHRHSTTRTELLCFRCFSLKHHNRLPHQYDTNQGFTTDSTEFILNKLLNRHRDKTGPQSVEFLYVVDAFDLIGTLQEWLFGRLMLEGREVRVVVNKIDIVNKEYISLEALHAAVNKKIKSMLYNIYKNQTVVKEKIQRIKVFYISCNSRDGMKKLKQYIQSNNNHIQLVGFPNTGKTTLLNILSKIKKSTSKIPGTTVKITQNNYNNNTKRKVYDMPGLYSKNLLYNLIQKPNIKAMLTWHKRIAPGLLTNSAFIYGGKVQVQDVRIVIFGLGGACQSTNRWFVKNYGEFWKGLPEPSSLKIKKYQFDLQFINGKTDDLEIAGYGFIGFRLCIPNVKKTVRKLSLYLPEGIEFGFRDSILSVNDAVFHRKSAIKKKFMLERLTLNRSYQSSNKKDKTQQMKQKKQIEDVIPQKDEQKQPKQPKQQQNKQF